MNILRRHMIEKTEGLRRLDEWDRHDLVTVIELDEGESRPPGPSSIINQHKFTLVVTVGQEFWCNPAQHNHARRVAERAIVNRLYEDGLRHISKLRSAIEDGDRNLAHRILSDLEYDIGVTE